MTSALQFEATCSNAQKSTGPRMRKAKPWRRRMPSCRACRPRRSLLKGKIPASSQCYRTQMLAELKLPKVESMLAHRIVGLSWRLRRAERLQTAAFDKQRAVGVRRPPCRTSCIPRRSPCWPSRTGTRRPGGYAFGVRPQGGAGLQSGEGATAYGTPEPPQSVPDDGRAAETAEGRINPPVEWAGSRP